MSWKFAYRKDKVSQDISIACFAGGKPILPRDMNIPACSLCGSLQTFFFQVKFPVGHAWAELTLAVFMCTSCADEEYLIPPMLEGILHDADVTTSFINEYQKNFCFLVFENGNEALVDSYIEKVTYIPISLISSDELSIYDDKLGGDPIWLLEDNSPGLLDGKISSDFLLQISEDRHYPIENNAAGQMEINLYGLSQESSCRFYELFLGNTIYIFGYKNEDKYLIYAITQT